MITSSGRRATFSGCALVDGRLPQGLRVMLLDNNGIIEMRSFTTYPPHKINIDESGFKCVNGLHQKHTVDLQNELLGAII